jgi:hypothetical protein
VDWLRHWHRNGSGLVLELVHWLGLMPLLLPHHEAHPKGQIRCSDPTAVDIIYHLLNGEQCRIQR